MNTRRLVAAIVSTAAVSAAAFAGVAPAQAADIVQRPDKGESVRRAPVLDDCSLRAPCSAVVTAPERNAQVSSLESTALAVDRTAGISTVVDRNVARIRATVRDSQVWSYTDDGALELRVNGVKKRHGRLLQ
ncbi:MAG: hypothetical protein ABR500_12080 [Dermatophilaceae bacterium]|nr:hypothetical protein [Intrasporangiaceae bacterium]